MNRVWWWMVERISRGLSLEEREAVHGDLAESGESGARALLDVTGLVLRRQGALWFDWRPWLALVGVALPFGLQLASNSLALRNTYDLNIWIMRNHGDIDPELLRSTGLSLSHGLARMAGHSLRLSAFSWIAGLALAALAGRTLRINAAAFCLMLILGEALGLRNYRYFVGGTAYPATLYAVVLPLVLQVVLVWIPSLWGMRRRLGMVATMVAAVAIAALSMLVQPHWRWWWNWPLVYLAATALWRRRRTEITA